MSWVNAIVGELELNVIAIDGKTMKQFYGRNDQQKALHIVTAWSSSHQLVLGQKKLDKKSNELTVIPELIEMLEIAVSVITIDAMGCQKNITSLIVKKKGDYILALKGNQQLLYKAVKEWFEVAQKADYLGLAE